MTGGLVTTVAGLALALDEATSAGVVMLSAIALAAGFVATNAFFPPPLAIRRVVQTTDRLATVGDDMAVDVHLEAHRRTAIGELLEVAVDDLAVRKGARSVRMSVRPLRAGETSIAQYRVALRERGSLRFLPMSWRRTDPLGLFRWSHRLDRGGEVLVGPAIVEIEDGARAHLERLRPRVPSRRTAEPDPFEFRELRTYVAGDDLRRVHWTSSARRNELMIREPERRVVEHVEPIHVVIDARVGEHNSTLELALSIGASLVDALREPFLVSLYTDDGVEQATSAAATFLLLAKVRREPSRTGERRLHRPVGSMSHTPSPLEVASQVIVTGPNPPARAEPTTVVFAAGAAPFNLARWEPGEPTRRAVSRTIAEVLAVHDRRELTGDDARGETAGAGTPLDFGGWT